MVNDILPEDQRRMPHDWPPLMHWAEFAKWIRVDEGIVRGWCERGYLPVFTLGRLRMVNLVKLIEQLKDGEQ